jgi:septal ring factor EnvC (AmiA/AmiB activator)
VDRLKWDLERLQDKLARVRKNIEDKERKSHDREANTNKLHAENCELASQLAAQTQTPLNMSERLDVVQESLRAAESGLAR